MPTLPPPVDDGAAGVVERFVAVLHDASARAEGERLRQIPLEGMTSIPEQLMLRAVNAAALPGRPAVREVRRGSGGRRL